nr:hypothetical retrotransposon [Ipomoea batatas]
MVGNTEDSKTMGTPLQTPNFDSATTMHGDLSKEPSSSANARVSMDLDENGITVVDTKRRRGNDHDKKIGSEAQLENVQNGDLVPEYQDDAANVDGHVDDFVHQEQEVPSQVPVDLPRRSVRERIPSTRYSSSQYVLLTEGGQNMSLMRKLWRVSKRDNGLRWNVELIRDLFDPMDVNQIMKTPVNREMEDGWYWRHELRGDYPVRSGYRLLSNSPQENNNFNSWGKLWKLDVEPKIRNLLWRCVKEILPSFNVNNVLRQALNWLTDWYDLIKRKVMTKVRTKSPQPTAALRCFVDAALFENVDLAGFGVIAVNNEDFIVTACSGTHCSSLDPYHAELWAIKEALS